MKRSVTLVQAFENEGIRLSPALTKALREIDAIMDNVMVSMEQAAVAVGARDFDLALVAFTAGRGYCMDRNEPLSVLIREGHGSKAGQLAAAIRSFEIQIEKYLEAIPTYALMQECIDLSKNTPRQTMH